MNAELVRISAFSDGDIGGNPAGVYFSDKHPDALRMQAIAAQVGYSETAFVEPSPDGFRVRYFAPESEVPFCGHATIAVGAALSRAHGPRTYTLDLNETSISVEGIVTDGNYAAALQSPTTFSTDASDALVKDALNLFGFTPQQLDEQLKPALANGGANHLIVALESRDTLSAMQYDQARGRQFMDDHSLVTIMLVYAQGKQLFHARNPFASGGVYEDPATGAAAAAFAGYLRDTNWEHGGLIDIVQGEDMGSRSLIRAEFTEVKGSSIRVSGAVRFMESPAQEIAL